MPASKPPESPSHALRVRCPRCAAHLLLHGPDGTAFACHACGLRLTVQGGAASYDPHDAGATEHVIECPRCSARLRFHAAEGESVSCSSCTLRLEIQGGRVVFDPRQLAAEAPPAPKGGRAASGLKPARKQHLLERFERACADLEPGAVRKALAAGRDLEGALDASALPASRRAAARLAYLREALKAWWDESAAFEWDDAAPMAATLLFLERPPAAPWRAETDDDDPALIAALVDACFAKVHAALAAHARDTGTMVP